jgi:hypothetical protein
MKIYIFGNHGNMGRRYAAILRYLGHEAVGGDVGDEVLDDREFKDYDGFIIATPTDTHLDYVEFLLKCGKPVLCEKPFINDWRRLGVLENVITAAEEQKMQLSMVSQYDFIRFDEKPPEGITTYYDFYRSGPDGIAWDCINVMWIATGKVTLKNESPVWKCMINGFNLDIKMMDYAYIEMIESWLKSSYKPQYDRILHSHQKVVDYLDGRFN